MRMGNKMITLWEWKNPVFWENSARRGQVEVVVQKAISGNQSTHTGVGCVLVFDPATVDEWAQNSALDSLHHPHRDPRGCSIQLRWCSGPACNKSCCCPTSPWGNWIPGLTEMFVPRLWSWSHSTDVRTSVELLLHKQGPDLAYSRYFVWMNEVLRKSDFAASVKIVVWLWLRPWLCLFSATHQLSKLTQEQNLFTEDLLSWTLFSFFLVFIPPSAHCWK